MKKQSKEETYAIKIASQLQGIFEEDSENYIDLSELADDDNATHFIHALANMVPAVFYNKFTEEPVNMLQFNHIANQLIFQYSRNEKEN